METKLNTVNMTAWVHKECNGIEEEAITKQQEAWDSSEQKDECTVRLNDLEGAYWMGTEMGQLSLGINTESIQEPMGTCVEKVWFRTQNPWEINSFLAFVLSRVVGVGKG